MFDLDSPSAWYFLFPELDSKFGGDDGLVVDEQQFDVGGESEKIGGE